MARPTPDYIPPELKEQAAKFGLTPYTYAQHLGLHKNRFYKFFGTNHSKLKPYLLICKAAEIELDELAVILRDGKFKKFIENLQKKTGQDSIGNLARALGISDGFIYQRINNPGVNGLGTYIELAQALGWSLEQLSDICSR